MIINIEAGFADIHVQLTSTTSENFTVPPDSSFVT